MKRRAILNGRRLAPGGTRSVLVALLLALGLVGCAEPPAWWKPPEAQYSLSDVRDWDAAAVRLVGSLEGEGYIPYVPVAPPGHLVMHPDRKPFPPPYYINVRAPGSAFLDEVRQRLEFEFLRRNFAVVGSPIGATVINLDVDTVHWASSIYPAGEITGVSTSVAPGPRTELVWRASILAGTREMVLSHETDWISEEDTPLYVGATNLPAMSSPGVAALGSPVPLRYAR